MKHIRTICFALVVSIAGLTVITYVHHTQSQAEERGLFSPPF